MVEIQQKKCKIDPNDIAQISLNNSDTESGRSKKNSHLVDAALLSWLIVLW